MSKLLLDTSDIFIWLLLCFAVLCVILVAMLTQQWIDNKRGH